MSDAKRAGDSPVMIDLEANKVYAWCACGKSNAQPWCNGAHSDGTITPNVFKSEESKTAAMCMCKQTSTPPYCDGSHAK